jgi:MFS family permease
LVNRTADWLGLNRATLAVLAVIGCLGLSEEVWSNFLSLHLKDQIANPDPLKQIVSAALYAGFISSATNLLEGFGYIIGGTVAHRMGPRVALAVSAIPMAVGFTIMLTIGIPWVISLAALMMTNWEPLSVPATFDVVGSEVPKNRRTVAFAVQSIQKRLPKLIGPWLGAILLVKIGYWMNLTVAFGLVGLAVVIQLTLTRKMKPKADPVKVPMREILKTMPPDLRRLLRAEIFIRWGDWFARGFAGLYVFSILTTRYGWTGDAATEAIGNLLALMALTALVTYIPMAKWIDRSESPRPFIGLTFFLFSIFPLSLVLLPRAAAGVGLPVMVGLALTFILNGLRELGEPARKALITTGFAPEIRARAVGIYWGVRSFAFFPAPIVAALLWSWIGPDATFIIGGSIGLIGTALFAWRRKA